MGVDITIVATLGVWWLVTALRQIDNRPALWSWDVFCLVPRWTFFAPSPIHSDYILLVQGDPSASEPWIRGPFLRRRDWRELLVNPQSRCNRVQHILTVRALEEMRSGQGEASVHYRALLDLASSLVERGSEPAMKVVVLESFGFVGDKPPQPVLMHPSPASSET